MSIYGDLICKDCRHHMYLGKVIRKPDGSVKTYSIGLNPETREYALVSRAIWKFLADHTGHNLTVLREHELDDLYRGQEEAWVEIGSDEDGGTSFEEFLRDWPD